MKEHSCGDVASAGSLAEDVLLPLVSALVRNGVPLLNRRAGAVVTSELVDRIREAEGV